MTRYSERTGQPQEYQVGPYDSPHLYVQWGGKLPGNEEWSCGFRMRKKSAGAIDSGSGLLVGVAAAIAEFHARPNTQIAGAAKLSFVKVNAVGTNGKYIGEGTNEATYPDLSGGGPSSARYPNQVAWAVSLTTGFSRGVAHRGRFYLPLPTPMLQADGRISDGDVDVTSASVDGLISNVNDANPDYEIAVFSRKAGSPGNRRVTGNEMGKVLDTQRRRRRALVEAYR